MGYAFHTQHTKKARKKHICRIHGGPINPGEPFNLHTGADGGQIWKTKICIPCEEYLKSKEGREVHEDILHDGLEPGEYPLKAEGETVQPRQY